MSNEIQEVIEAEIVVEDDGLSVLPADVARDLTDKIRQALEFTWDLVIQAYQGGAWIALGYKSWNDYCVKEFGSQHIAIPREDRDEVIGSLRSAGLSTRAIAGATGLSKGTVGNSLKKVNEEASSSAQKWALEDSSDAEVAADPGPLKIKGVNQKTYSSQPPKPKPKNDDAIEQPLDGQADIADALDTSLEDLGITPISPNEVVDRNAKTRVQLVKRLTGSNGQYTQAPLPMVISLAGQIVERTAGVNDLDVEEVTSFADDSSRAVLVLARLLETIDPDEIDDDKTRAAIEQNLNQAQEYLDNFLTTLTEV
ncbi:hypothetical protein [Glutamicibacter sp. FBE19]|uniref:hypothetical protein n=1 Tax=Glutamicibacter sp. FBE19 TaxID=2761534 RepID=UPI001896784A|nr:hypothetical protein [Glutamicibacter sp. FBE19]MBF6671181.1 hypothetical protein [Glutamicibacter sp. FBE19]